MFLKQYKIMKSKKDFKKYVQKENTCTLIIGKNHSGKTTTICDEMMASDFKNIIIISPNYKKARKNKFAFIYNDWEIDGLQIKDNILNFDNKTINFSYIENLVEEDFSNNDLFIIDELEKYNDTCINYIHDELLKDKIVICTTNNIEISKDKFNILSEEFNTQKYDFNKENIVEKFFKKLF